jgi:hypothetical protein
MEWDEFVEGSILRFGPLAYDHVGGELAKIQQTSTVSEYQSHFERLCPKAICENFHLRTMVRNSTRSQGLTTSYINHIISMSLNIAYNNVC